MDTVLITDIGSVDPDDTFALLCLLKNCKSIKVL